MCTSMLSIEPTLRNIDDPTYIVDQLCREAEEQILPRYLGSRDIMSAAIVIRACILCQVVDGLWYELGIEAHRQMCNLTVTVRAITDGNGPKLVSYDFSRTVLPSCLARLVEPWL